MKKGTKLDEDIEPIKSKSKLKLFSSELLRHGKMARRNYTAWVIGVNCLLRVSDILKLKYNQIYKSDGTVNTYVRTHDKKTKKYNPLYLTNIRQPLEEYRQWRIKNGINSSYMFPKMTDMTKPLSRTAIYNAWKRIADYVGISNFSCHVARKTGAYMIYKATGNLAQVQSLLHHSRPSITLRYLGITSKSKVNAINKGIGNIFK